MPYIASALSEHHMPAFIFYRVYIGEVIAPVFIILGLWTRIASLVVVFNMSVAI
jgi:putative oxidoreductase